MKVNTEHAIAGAWRPIVTAALEKPVGNFFGQLYRAFENQTEFVLAHIVSLNRVLIVRTSIHCAANIPCVVFRASRRGIDGLSTPLAVMERTIGTAPNVSPGIRFDHSPSLKLGVLDRLADVFVRVIWQRLSFVWCLSEFHCTIDTLLGKHCLLPTTNRGVAGQPGDGRGADDDVFVKWMIDHGGPFIAIRYAAG